MKPAAVRVALACALAGLGAASSAGAATVTEVAQSYTVGTSGATATNGFSVATPGNLDISLTDLLWPQALANLSFELTNSQGKVLGTISGAGTLDVALAASGTYFALSYGQASATGPLPYGSYGVSVQYTPTVVPLPASAVLLASAMGLVAALHRRRPAGASARRTARGQSRGGTVAAISV